MSTRGARSWLLAVSLGCMAFFANAVDPLVTIEMPVEVQVTQSPVRLGEVAGLAARDPQLLRRLAGLSLGSAPAAGQLVNLRREAVEPWIRRQLSLGSGEIHWTGAQETRVVGQPSPDAVATRLLRGSWATLELRRGAVALESRVEVLEDVRADGLVRVRRSGAAGSLLARVVGPSRLEVAP